MLGLDPISFWKTTLKFDSSLSHLATMIFRMKGHAAPIESLFSGMSYTKTKTCNHMNVENLKMFTMIQWFGKTHSWFRKKAKKTKEIWWSQHNFNFDSLCGECRCCWREYFIWSWKIVWWNVIGPRWQIRTFGHNNDQAFLIEKPFNLTELKKSKSDNFVAVEEWKTDDNPSEYNFLICDILNL